MPDRPRFRDGSETTRRDPREAPRSRPLGVGPRGGRRLERDGGPPAEEFPPSRGVPEEPVDEPAAAERDDE